MRQSLVGYVPFRAPLISTVMESEHTRQYAGAARGGGGGIRITIRKHGRVARKSFNVGRGRKLVAIYRHVFCSECIEGDQQHIRFRPRCEQGRSYGGRRLDECKLEQ